MENKQFDSQQSMALIAEMINNTRQRMERNAGRPFLIWGYVTVFVAFFEYYVNLSDMNPAWNWAWWSIPVLGSLLMRFFCRKDAGYAANYIDRVIGAVWLVFGISTLFAFAAAAFYKISILFLIVLLMGMGTAVTGLIIRYTPVVVAGFGAMCASLLFVWFRFNPQYYSESILLFAAIFAGMMIIPGHILNYKSNRNKA